MIKNIAFTDYTGDKAVIDISTTFNTIGIYTKPQKGVDAYIDLDMEDSLALYRFLKEHFEPEQNYPEQEEPPYVEFVRKK